MVANKGDMDRSSAGKGTFLRPFGRDNSSHKVSNTKGGSMGGSTKNLSHSLPGVSANQKLK